MQQPRPVQYANPFRIIAKFFLFILVKITMFWLNFWRRYPLPALMLVVVAVGSFFAISSGTVVMPWAGAPAAAPAPEARVAVETFLTGQKNYNTALMWDALDDQFKQGLYKRGRSFESIKKVQQSMQAAGVKIAPQHIGGSDLADGSKVYFYIITVTQGQDILAQVPQTFGVNKAGKIVSIQPLIEEAIANNGGQ